MPEETIESLRSKNAELSRRNIELAAEAKKYRLRSKKLQAENGTIAAERDDLKNKAAAPPDEEVKTLRAQLLDRDHRDAWKALQADPEIGLNPKISLDKVWKSLDYRPEGEAKPETIKALLVKARETDGHLFVEASQEAGTGTEADPEAPIRVAPTPPLQGTGGGAGRAPSALRPTEAQLRDPRWMWENQHRLATPDGEKRGW